MESCRAGIITMDYQPGHPHGFCSADLDGRDRIANHCAIRKT
ncbi:hypothetical protein [Bradyrhizobium lupini]|jgi:hypothetical protein